MDQAPVISVVSPFFNEELIIAESVRRMAANLDAQFGTAWELIIVDDGSTDGGRGRVRDLLAEGRFPRVRLFACDVNQGRGRALKNGIDEAQADIIVTTEADCSWGDDIVRRLYDAITGPGGPDVVIASVHAAGGGLVHVPLHRRLLSQGGNILLRMFVDPGITMSTGMTRAYRRAVIQPLVTHENGKEFHLEVILKLRTLGFRIGEIPATISWQPKTKTQTRKSSTRILKTINSHLLFMAIGQPARYFGVAALMAALGGTAFLVDGLVRLLSGQISVYMALIALILYLFALLLTGLSVVFVQMKEVLRENWIRSYPLPWPPSSLRARNLTPPADGVPQG